MEIRKKFVKTFVWSVLLYGSETWTLGKIERDRLEAAEMWMWRRLTRTSWVEKKSNAKVLEEINEKRMLVKELEKRRIKFIGHILRHNELLINIFEGKMLGKRTRGRPRRSFMEGVVGRLKFKSYQEMKSTAGDRDSFISFICLFAITQGKLQKGNGKRPFVDHTHKCPNP